ADDEPAGGILGDVWQGLVPDRVGIDLKLVADEAAGAVEPLREDAERRTVVPADPHDHEVTRRIGGHHWQVLRAARVTVDHELAAEWLLRPRYARRQHHTQRNRP